MEAQNERPKKRWQRGRRRNTIRLSPVEMREAHEAYLQNEVGKKNPSKAHMRAIFWIVGAISDEEYRSEKTLQEIFA